MPRKPSSKPSASKAVKKPERANKVAQKGTGSFEAASIKTVESKKLKQIVSYFTDYVPKAMLE